MIQARSLGKSYGEQILFQDASFAMGKGERLGLIGKNGHGKSTLFKLILNQEAPDGGSLDFPKKYCIGHLQQHLTFTEPSILAEACAALPVHEGGWREDHKAEATLMGLGFKREDLERPASDFSGGWQIRVNLAKLLLQEPDMLLLDEPTNYLDILSTRWLERVLRQWPGELILITHDRKFMDSVCSHTMVIHRKGFRRVEGNTEKLWDTILLEEEQFVRTQEALAKRRAELEDFVRRFKSKATKAVQAQSRVKMLERMGEVQELENVASLEFRFRGAPFPGRRMLEAKNLGFHWPDAEDLFSGLDLQVSVGDRIGIIGPNGRGKSTLLRTLCGDLTPTSGEVEVNENAHLAVFGQTHIERLNPEWTVAQTIAAELPFDEAGRARGIAGLMMFEGDAALKKVKILSGGEKSRVHLGRILARPANILLLDEPTNHLDQDSVETLIEAIEEFEGAALVVSHSEELLERVCNRLVIFDQGRCSIFEGGYAEFLQKIGWQSEKPQSTAVDTAPKMDRAARAKWVSDRSKALKPLKSKVEKSEAEMSRLETLLAAVQSELLEASQANDGAEIVRLSQASQKTQEALDQEFENWTLASEALEAAEQEWSQEPS